MFEEKDNLPYTVNSYKIPNTDQAELHSSFEKVPSVVHGEAAEKEGADAFHTPSTHHYKCNRSDELYIDHPNISSVPSSDVMNVENENDFCESYHFMEHNQKSPEPIANAVNDSPSNETSCHGTVYDSNRMESAFSEIRGSIFESENVASDNQEPSHNQHQQTQSESGYKSSHTYNQVSSRDYISNKDTPEKKTNDNAKHSCNPVIGGLVFGAVASLVFACTCIGMNMLHNTDCSNEVVLSTVSPTISSINTGASDIPSVAESCMPSIVSITSKTTQTMFSLFGGMQEFEAEGLGSGIIVGNNGSEILIATNNHVISGSSEMTVTFIDEASVEASLKGTDEYSDVAIISVPIDSLSESTLGTIKVAAIGDSDSAKVGENVIAIGNALGYGQTVTSGIISAKERDLSDDGINGLLIQTDAAINPGNSGGALLNMSGEVIGINVAKATASTVEGIGYAIPISDVEDNLTSMMNSDTLEEVSEEERGYLGVMTTDVSQEMAELYNIPMGVYVTETVSGGAAAEAEIQTGDIITGIDSTTVTTSDGLKKALKYYKIGDTVKITFQRISSDGNYEKHTANVVLMGAIDSDK